MHVRICGVFCVHIACRCLSSISGANVHAETATKDTAITYACANGHTNVAALLLDYGADLVWTTCVTVCCIICKHVCVAVIFNNYLNTCNLLITSPVIITYMTY